MCYIRPPSSSCTTLLRLYDWRPSPLVVGLLCVSRLLANSKSRPSLASCLLVGLSMISPWRRTQQKVVFKTSAQRLIQVMLDVTKVLRSLQRRTTRPTARMLLEPGQTCSKELPISRCTTCFYQCLSENGYTGSSRLHSYYLVDWSQFCTSCEKSRHRSDCSCPTKCWHSTTLKLKVLFSDSCEAMYQQYFDPALRNYCPDTP